MRIIPDISKCMILRVIPNASQENYENWLVGREIALEKQLIDIMGEVGISATVKTDRYSLPPKHEVVHVKMGGSYLNDAFITTGFFRKILKELLEKNVVKIRFYIYMEILEGGFGFGKVKYRFVYYIH